MSYPLGRLSLAVDFPTEGHVYHFQKVKANAVLDIKIAYGVTFVVVALVFFGLAIFFSGAFR